ncbi:MAG: DUF3810 domain-containing protein [Clostridiales bacterium]|jgi:hypothetical protein|nr:DUF3810 domain-containing protein [Clostridiales bacterium]
MKIKKPKKLKGILITLSSLIAFFFVAYFIGRDEKIAEWITLHITRYYIGAVSFITSKIPFSLYEFCVAACVIWIVILLIIVVVGLKKKKIRFVFRSVLIFLIAAVSVADIYMFTAGITYNRAPLPILTDNDYDNTYGYKKVYNAAYGFLRDYDNISRELPRDEYGMVVSPYSVEQLNALLNEEFKRLEDDYFFSVMPTVKVADNAVMTSGIAGLAFIPFGEANINATLTAVRLPYVVAHEIAHIKGIIRESDVELTVCRLLLTSENAFFRYSGYFEFLRQLESALIISKNNVYEAGELIRRRFPTASASSSVPQDASWFEKNIFYPVDKSFDRIHDVLYDLVYRMFGEEGWSDSYKSPYGVVGTGEKIASDYIYDEEIGAYIPCAWTNVYKPIYSEMHKMLFSIYETDLAWIDKTEEFWYVGPEGEAPSMFVALVINPDGTYECLATYFSNQMIAWVIEQFGNSDEARILYWITEEEYYIDGYYFELRISYSHKDYPTYTLNPPIIIS